MKKLDSLIKSLTEKLAKSVKPEPIVEDDEGRVVRGNMTLEVKYTPFISRPITNTLCLGV